MTLHGQGPGSYGRIGSELICPIVRLDSYSLEPTGLSSQETPHLDVRSVF